MSINYFLNLKEIDSLAKMRISHLKAIAEQDDRLQKLNSRLLENTQRADALKQELFTLQHTMHEIDKKIRLFQKQKQNLMDIGESGEKYTAQIDEAEGQGLELLDTIEARENELRELREFETGFRKTLDEIQTEANEIKLREEHEIGNLDFRIKALEGELPDNFRLVLNKVQAKNLAHGSFTRVEAGSCYFCRYKISRIDESEIDLQQQLKQCPQCSRIFLPYGS